MEESPSDRCGYTYPSDYEIGSDPHHENSCYRESLPDTDRCAWHAHTDQTDQKTVENLRAARAPTDIRDQNYPIGELLDGAVLVATELEDALSFASTSLRGADLSDASLLGADLTDAVLSMADLSGANLSDADLPDADLSHADLSGTKISAADLSDADLSHVDLSDADLSHVDLSGADLSHVDLSGADLSHADLTEADLSHADLTEADLSHADLTEADLIWADLDGAVFFQATLREATLQDGRALRQADLTETDLQGQDLRGENLSGAALAKADLTDSDLSGADLSGANLERALLNRADLFDTRLAGARLEGAVVGNVQINEGAFEQLASESADPDNRRSLGERLRTLVFGPTGHDTYRCVYDPMSRFDLPEPDDEIDSDPSDDTVGSEDPAQDTATNDGPTVAVDPSESTGDGDGEDDPEELEFGGTVEEDEFDFGVNDTGSIEDLATGNQSIKDQPGGADSGPAWLDDEVDDGFSFDDDSDDVWGDSDDTAADDAGRERRQDDPEVQAGGVYRQLERLAGDNALPGWQRRFFILRQDMQTRQKTGLDRAFALVQRALFGYGESFGRIVGWAGTIIVAFAVVYLAGGWIRPIQAGGGVGRAVSWTRLPGDLSVIWESLYYSTLTFTALGFGDFRPVGGLGQALTIAETATGALLLALLVFVLGRRAAR